MGRFFLGFAIGALLGALAVLLTGRSEDTGERQGLAAATGGLRSLATGALAAGRSAAGAKEQELLADFRTRLKDSAASTRTDPFATL